MASTSTSCRAYDDDNGSSSRRARADGAAEAPSRQPSHLAKGKRLRNGRVPRALASRPRTRGRQLPCVRRRQRQQLAPRASRWRRGGAKQIALAPREGQALEERPSSSRSAGRPRTAWRPLLPAAVRTTTTTAAARAAREQMAPRRRRADSPRTSRRAGAKGGPGKVGGDLAHRERSRPAAVRHSRQRQQLARDRRGEQTGTPDRCSHQPGA